MNVSHRWLRELAPTVSDSPEEIAELLASRGFPVEEVERLSEGLEGLVVGRVERVREHPDADRLILCDVAWGESDAVQVVCGAPNVREGASYPFAPVGSELPGGQAIGKVRLRGQHSSGMLCSEAELELGEDASGLMELTGDVRPGQPLVEALGLNDTRMEVEVTPNRPDLLSHRGVAREVAPGGEMDLRLPPVPGSPETTPQELEGLESKVDEREAEGGGGVRVRIEAPELCGAYLGLVIRGVRVGPSPRWLQTRLRAAGSRPINNIVDATNYVLLELGHPLHAFDLNRLEGQRIVVRRARAGERIRTLDGVDRRLTTEMLAICDDSRPVAVAGVMGGSDSEVSEETTDVFLECALFAPGPIRATRKALGMSSDASYRFERGVDPDGLREAILRAAELVTATAGGRLEGPLLEVRPESFSPATVRLRPSRVEQVLGVPFTPESIAELLEPLGFTVAPGDSDGLSVQVPGFRSWDVTREVDLVEEVARMHGYDAFPDTLAPYRPGTVPDDPLFQLEDSLRDDLVRRGLLEAHTLAFAPEDEGEVEVVNPVSIAERFLRRHLLPGLLRRVEYNLARGNRDVRLFELGTVFRRGSEGQLPRERTHLALALHGLRRPRHWSEEEAPLDPWELKGILEEIAARLGTASCEVRPASDADGGDAGLDARFHEGTALVLADEEGQVRGWGGRLDAGDLDLPPWAGELWGAEVALPQEPRVREAPSYDPLPLHPAVDRDLALLVNRDLPAQRVVGLLREEGGEHMRRVEVFDVYEGGGLPRGKRSIAVRMHFRADERTLKDAEVDERMTHLIRSLEEELDVQIRGRQG